MGDLSRRYALMLGAGLASTVVMRPAVAQAPLITRPIPHSGEMLPVVGLGTANNFGNSERADLRKVLESLVAGGGKLIDTASTYGASETVIGELVSETKLRDRVLIATKLEAENAAGGAGEFRTSRQKLRTEKVDLQQLHNVSKANQSLSYLRDWKAQGLCRYTGVTSTSPRDFTALEAVVRREKPDFVQFNYSLGDRGVEARLIPAAVDAGSAVLTALPFGRNLLFRAVRGKQLPDWAKEFDANSWGQFFLKYLIGNKDVTAVIPGTNKAEHMIDNLGAGRGRLPDAAQRRKMVEFFQQL